MTIGDRIFERLKEINMTQKEFSNETGISQSTISEWKSKKNNPTSGHWYRVLLTLSDRLYVIDAGRNSGTVSTVENSIRYDRAVIRIK